MKVTIYPYSINKGDIRVNPYISDFIHALQQNGITIANPPHKNPLFSLIPRKADSDAYIFLWWHLILKRSQIAARVCNIPYL